MNPSAPRTSGRTAPSLVLNARRSWSRRLGLAVASLVQRCVALAMLILLTPLFASLWVAMKITAPGPFLFKQVRPGRHGEPIDIWKIRTMVVGADRDKSLGLGVTASNPKITRLGRILREVKLDELPQLWCIVCGTMEFVGPRPIARVLHDKLAESILGFDERLSLRPGLTNLGQVSVLDNAVDEKLIEDWSVRFEAERHYIRNKSLFYDLIIVAMTGLFVLKKAWNKISRGKAAATEAEVASVGLEIVEPLPEAADASVASAGFEIVDPMLKALAARVAQPGAKIVEPLNEDPQFGTVAMIKAARRMAAPLPVNPQTSMDGVVDADEPEVIWTGEKPQPVLVSIGGPEFP